jgi:hypothetical protein
MEEEFNIPIVLMMIFIALSAGGIGYWMSNYNASIEQAVLEEKIIELESRIGESTEEMGSQDSSLTREFCSGIWKEAECIFTTCFDTDPQDNYFVGGNVSYLDEEGLQYSIDDYCIDDSRVAEVYCKKDDDDGYTLGERRINCPGRCVDGVCRVEESILKIISPNGGENFCLGEEVIIEWEHAGLDAVTLYVQQGGTSNFMYPLATVSANQNETGETGSGLFIWRVGEDKRFGELKESTAYKIYISAQQDRSLYSDTSDGVFSVQLCEG